MSCHIQTFSHNNPIVVSHYPIHLQDARYLASNLGAFQSWWVCGSLGVDDAEFDRAIAGIPGLWWQGALVMHIILRKHVFSRASELLYVRKRCLGFARRFHTPRRWKEKIPEIQLKSSSSAHIFRIRRSWKLQMGSCLGSQLLSHWPVALSHKI